MEPGSYRRAAREYFAGRMHTDAFAGGTHRAQLRARVLPTPSADDRSRETDDGDGEPVAEVLRSAAPRAALIARPGGGKTTTLLQHALALAADDDGPLPVYVQLRDLDGGYTDLERLIVESMQQVVPEAARSVRTRPHDFTVGDRRYAIVAPAAYGRRLAGFADFFARTLGQPYPLDPRDQARLWVWDDLGVVVLGLSSVGEIDGLRPGNATIDDTALSRALASLRGAHDESLKIAVFHHPLDSPAEDRLRDAKFLERLAVAGFSLVLHGHVHQADNRLFRYDRTAKGRRIEVVGAGTFGARSAELPTGCPWQYNLLRFTGDRVRVETRHRVADNAPWKAHACWSTGAGEEPRSWYELELGPGR